MIPILAEVTRKGYEIYTDRSGNTLMERPRFHRISDMFLERPLNSYPIAQSGEMQAGVGALPTMVTNKETGEAQNFNMLKDAAKHIGFTNQSVRSKKSKSKSKEIEMGNYILEF